MKKLRNWVGGRGARYAEGRVCRSNAWVSLKSTINQLNSMLIDFRNPTAEDSDLPLLEAAAIMRPWDSGHGSKVRVGRNGDGGYVMLETFDVAGAISIGVGSEVSWDVAIR